MIRECWRGKDKLARVAPIGAVIPFTAVASEVSFSASLRTKLGAKPTPCSC